MLLPEIAIPWPYSRLIKYIAVVSSFEYGESLRCRGRLRGLTLVHIPEARYNPPRLSMSSSCQKPTVREFGDHRQDSILVANSGLENCLYA
jgi:hypothetical protein